jgi:hypothetical protein
VEELVQYAIRRSLIGPDEGERLLHEVRGARGKKGSAKSRAAGARPKSRGSRSVRKPAASKKAASGRSRR